VAISGLVANGDLPSTLARVVSIGVMLSLGISVLADWRLGGLRNLVRADLMAILAFYFLTLFEFLFPQPTFDAMVDLRATHEGLICVLLGFTGLLIGRHLLHPKKQPFTHTLTRETPAIWIVLIFWTCFFIGYMHMLIAVNFNPIEMIEWFMEPRFTQPWGRGRFGDWKAMLFELGMLINLIPPLAGIIIARRQRYSTLQLTLVCLGLALTLFFGFTTGTRNIIATYLVTFLIAYTFTLSAARQKELIVLFAASGLFMVFATYFMLQFRGVGFRNYLAGNYEPPPPTERTFFVDYNLYAISRLTEVFPAKKAYLGWEIPYLALVRPIPRAIWPAKPEGMSYTIEDAMGVDGNSVTIAASFVGEAYISGGLIAVFIIATGFGALTGWWSHLASPKNSELGILIYASGFFASVISMRSLFVFTTALLPTVAAMIIGTYAVKILTNQAQRLLLIAARRSAPVRRPAPPPQRPAR
jgi:oligosaccharide repeat unit polymerase